MPDNDSKPAPATTDDWPVFVISLTDAHARRAEVTRQLDALGIPFTFVDAVDGRKSLPAEYEHLVDRPGTRALLFRAMADAEYATALSHMSVYRRVLDDGLPGAVILEDDVILKDSFGLFMQDHGYRHAAIVHLDYDGARVWKNAKVLARIGETKLLPVALPGVRATGYSISCKAAKHLMRHALPVRSVVDWPDCVGALDCVLALPRIVDNPPMARVPSATEPSRKLALQQKTSRSGRFLRRSYWRHRLFTLMSRNVG